MSFPAPIPVLTPELFSKLKERTESVLIHIIKTNSSSRYVQESPVFHDFRNSLARCSPEQVLSQPDILIDSFCRSVPLTAYDSYEPFVQRLVASQCKESEVKDLFAPGLPYYVAASSATSGKTSKFFAKYRHPPGISYESVNEHANPVSKTGGTKSIVFSLVYRQAVEVVGEDGQVVKKYPVTLGSSGAIRMQNDLGLEKDPFVIALTAPQATTPAAVAFVANYRSFLMLHALFALADSRLESMNTLFGTVFIDIVRYIEEEWESFIVWIENGTIPDLDGIEHVRQYLEPQFTPKPDRAAELRAVGKATDSPGWLQKIWPGFKVVIGIASGVFASVVPKMRHYLGPDVTMRSLGFTASESYVGTVYESDDKNLNLFKVCSDENIEYLDVTQDETAANVVLAWQVEAGKQYEVITTTRDGMWRYRLGDIVEVVGFDPQDGSPIIKFIERRNVAIRVSGAMISEKQLVDGIAATEDTLGQVVEFTVFTDDRTLPSGLGYIVELQDSPGPNAHLAIRRMIDQLGDSNPNIERCLTKKVMAPPTIRIVEPGTFREFRRMKTESANLGSGQVKVPVVLWDETIQKWITERVIQEIK